MLLLKRLGKQPIKHKKSLLDIKSGKLFIYLDGKDVCSLTCNKDKIIVSTCLVMKQYHRNPTLYSDTSFVRFFYDDGINNPLHTERKLNVHNVLERRSERRLTLREE